MKNLIEVSRTLRSKFSDECSRSQSLKFPVAAALRNAQPSEYLTLGIFNFGNIQLWDYSNLEILNLGKLKLGNTQLWEYPTL